MSGAWDVYQFFMPIYGRAQGLSATAIGSIMIPAMKREGYKPSFAVAVTSCAALMGPIIPPSIIAVIYGELPTPTELDAGASNLQFTTEADTLVGSESDDVFDAGLDVALGGHPAPLLRRVDGSVVEYPYSKPSTPASESMLL